MLHTIRRHTLFVIALLLAIVNAGILCLAAASSYGVNATGAPESAGKFLARSNAHPPASYSVRAGETVFDIAAKLGIPYYDLILENRLSGEQDLVAGMTLAVPVFPVPTVSLFPGPIPAVRVDRRAGRAPLAVTLAADTDDLKDSDRFFWDLGHHRYAFSDSVTAFYTRPGVYRPQFVVVDSGGRYFFSAPQAITVTDVAADYSGLPHLTAERIGDFIDVSGRLRTPSGATVDFDDAGVITQTVALVTRLDTNRLIAVAGGFSRVRLECRGGVFEFLLFVSPLPARLSAEPEYDWYKTQYNTGMYGNCGPAAIGSAIRWSTGEDLTVEEVRAEIGMPYPNGAVDYDNLLGQLSRHHAPAEKQPLGGMFDIFGVIDSGGLVVVSFNCGRIRLTDRDETTDFFDRYYPDATGHYLLIKGYTLDRRYFIVYDAIPGEWDLNDTRYRDGQSMIGRNRFFRTEEVMAGISQKNMIVIRRQTPAD
jgi:hypothetical protein